MTYSAQIWSRYQIDIRESDDQVKIAIDPLGVILQLRYLKFYFGTYSASYIFCTNCALCVYHIPIFFRLLKYKKNRLWSLNVHFYFFFDFI